MAVTYQFEDAAPKQVTYQFEDAALPPVGSRERFILDEQGQGDPSQYPPALGIQPGQSGGIWNTVKTIAAEPFKLAGEAVAAPLNAALKAGKGYMGLASAVKMGLQGASLDEALRAGTDTIGNRNSIESPLGLSETSKFVGDKVLQPAIQKLGSTTGQPELVQGIAEVGGDVAGLLGIKPGISAAKNIGQRTLKAAADSGIGVLSPEKIYASAAKLPLSKAWVKSAGEDQISKRTNVIKAGLDAEVPINEAGITKAKNLEQSFRQHVDDIVAGLDETGTLIPKTRLQQGLEKAHGVATTEGTDAAVNFVNRLYDKKFEKMGTMVKTGEREIPGQPAQYRTGDMGEQVLISEATPSIIEPIFERQYKPSEIQRIKRHLYKQANYEASNLSRNLGSQLKELANKGMAKEAKLSLEEMHPELKNLNKKDAAYIGLVDALERAVPRIQNNNMVGIGAKMLITGNAPWLGILDHAIGLPSVKGKLAFALNRARRQAKAPITGNITKVAVTTVANDSTDQK